MSRQEFYYTRECCATCSFWDGERVLSDIYGSRLYTESSFTKGECMCRASKWFRQDKQATLKCDCYEKWGALK